MFKGNAFIQYSTEDYKLDNLYGARISGEEISLDSLCKTNYKLIFRYSDQHCNQCAESALHSLNKFKESIGEDNIIILASFRTKHQFAFFLKNNQSTNMVLNISTKIEIPIEEYITPYFFIMDKDMTVKLLFIPMKEIPGHTDAYLKSVLNRFFEKNSMPE